MRVGPRAVGATMNISGRALRAGREATSRTAATRLAVASFAVVPTWLMAAAADASVIGVPDDGFEFPNLGSGANAYAYASNNLVGRSPTLPTSGPVAFSSTAGIAANGSLFGVFDASNGIISLTFAVPASSAGAGTLSFQQEPRGGLGAGVLIVLDNTTGVANEAPFAGETLQSPAIQENLGNLAAGSHIISFVADSGGSGVDLTTFIDDVSITTAALPEPTSLVAAGAASAVCFGLTRRRRSARG